MSPEVLRTIAALRKRVAQARQARLRVGCVPTMGALHPGHTALFDRARTDCDLLVATLFVNPTQFDRPDDLEQYPRDFETDLQTCRRHAVDALFAPSVKEMYPGPAAVSVDVEGLASNLCGASRPGHFRGVATVVLKLLNIVQCDVAYFGEKDYQQLTIIQRLVEDTNLDVEIVGVETVREQDGLALSSRNVLLSDAERAAAPVLLQSLSATRAAIEAGETDGRKLCKRARRMLERERLLRLDYFDIVDPRTLDPVDRIAGPVRIALAAYFGSTRLIDNLAAVPPEGR